MPPPQDDNYICDSLGEMGSLYTALISLFWAVLFQIWAGNPLDVFETPILAGTSDFKNKAIFETLASRPDRRNGRQRFACQRFEKKLEELHHNRPLMTDKNRKQIADIVRLLVVRQQTADYLLQNLAKTEHQAHE